MLALGPANARPATTINRFQDPPGAGTAAFDHAALGLEIVLALVEVVEPVVDVAELFARFALHRAEIPLRGSRKIGEGAVVVTLAQLLARAQQRTIGDVKLIDKFHEPIDAAHRAAAFAPRAGLARPNTGRPAGSSASRRRASRASMPRAASISS